MTPQRNPLDAIAISSMVACCFLLGLQQVAIKLASNDIAPVMQLSLRSLIGLLLVLIAMKIGRQLSFDKHKIALGLAVGALFALEFLLLGEALRYTSASRSVVFLYTSPLFSALFLHFLVKDEQLIHRQKVGILLAFLGIVVAFATHSATTSHSLLGDGLALLAGLCWGLTTVILRMTPLGSLPAKQMLVYQLFMVFVVLLIYGLATHQAQFTLSLVGVSSIAFQAIFISFVASMAWFWLLSRYRSADIGALVLMTPIFGVVLSAWILGETISISFVIGAMMVLVGIVLVGKR